MMIQDKSLAVPRQLRVAAILASGYEKFNADAEKCSQMLSKLVQSGDEDKSVVVCAAVALLRLSDWMDEEANVILQRLLHEEKVCADCFLHGYFTTQLSMQTFPNRLQNLESYA